MDRGRDPISTYVLLELLIGLFGLSSPWVFVGIERAYFYLHPLIDAGLRDVRALPNPSGTTSGVSIRYRMDRRSKVTLTVFSVTGRRIRRIHQNHVAGPGAFLWDGRTDAGSLVPAGIYFYRLEAPGGDGVSGKLTLVQ